LDLGSFWKSDTTKWLQKYLCKDTKSCQLKQVWAENNWMKASRFTKKKTQSTDIDKWESEIELHFRCNKKQNFLRLARNSKLNVRTSSSKKHPRCSKINLWDRKKLQLFLSIWNVSTTSGKIGLIQVNSLKTKVYSWIVFSKIDITLQKCFAIFMYFCSKTCKNYIVLMQ